MVLDEERRVLNLEQAEREYFDLLRIEDALYYEVGDRAFYPLVYSDDE